MLLTIRVLGLELLSIEASTGEAEAECSLDGGTTSATGVSFLPSPGDQRWEPGAGAGEL